EIEATRRASLVSRREIYIAEPPKLERRISGLRLANFGGGGHMLRMLHQCRRRAPLRRFAFTRGSLQDVGNAGRLFALAFFKLIDPFFQLLDTIEQSLERRVRRR